MGAAKWCRNWTFWCVRLSLKPHTLMRNERSDHCLTIHWPLFNNSLRNTSVLSVSCKTSLYILYILPNRPGCTGVTTLELAKLKACDGSTFELAKCLQGLYPFRGSIPLTL